MKLTSVLKYSRVLSLDCLRLFQGTRG
ncbi:hypothetical protein PanWU01x14_017660 [Parasponia andersonii]|uniref:Uncharacterized protein n=1 Tax=Parasponia andersonii TaxID=3476 RepID=A0A2P5DYY7_PARAD|nr:hypothetical protein PanWU01x14_017660 [Parasponia andersonii]